MKTADFNYNLPQNLIAQTPLKNRDSSKLMVIDKKTKTIKHEHFYNIGNYLNKGDVLVLNDTKVIPARLIGEKKETGAIIELLLLKNLQQDDWECLAKPTKRLKIGTIISFGDDKLQAKVLKILNDGIIHVQMIYKGIFYEILNDLGLMPLPPYIKEKLKDKDRYQTVYAKNIGSAAAPTAGLHFTKNLLLKLKNKGINIEYITLHVGIGTFRPVVVEDVSKHEMHSEYYSMDEKTALALNKAKNEGRKIIAVGTTTVRTLETIMAKYKEFKECSGETNIFIYPGFQFKAVDQLITNFHLPKSTLLMLVSALAGKDFILKAYQEAIEHEYRFFSFGDSMLIK